MGEADVHVRGLGGLVLPVPGADEANVKEEGRQDLLREANKDHIQEDNKQSSDSIFPMANIIKPF